MWIVFSYTDDFISDNEDGESDSWSTGPFTTVEAAKEWIKRNAEEGITHIVVDFYSLTFPKKAVY